SDRNAVLRANWNPAIRLEAVKRTGRPADCHAAIGFSGIAGLRADRIAGLTLVGDMDRHTVIPLHRVPGRRLPWNAVLLEYRNNLAAIACRSRELQHGFPSLRAYGIAGLIPIRDIDRQTVLPLHRVPGWRLSREAVVREDRNNAAILSCRPKEPQHSSPVSPASGKTVVP
ncbi:MAG: hypothetical protein ACRCUC_08815, partial [Aestuariivirga sp.]